jgi:hypothetical protein
MGKKIQTFQKFRRNADYGIEIYNQIIKDEPKQNSDLQLLLEGLKNSEN